MEGDDLALLIRSANGYLFPGRWSGHADTVRDGGALLPVATLPPPL